jgi:two-component system, chemotaxis family, chemotaxis protein CheY
MAKILVVDDSGLSRRTLRKILEAEGHEINEAADGESALEQYFLDRPDVVLLDLVMKGMYGIDVLTRLREMDAGARVIVASADIQNSTHAIVKEGGACAFITKPFMTDQVTGAVKAALEGKIYGTE